MLDVTPILLNNCRALSYACRTASLQNFRAAIRLMDRREIHGADRQRIYTQLVDRALKNLKIKFSEHIYLHIARTFELYEFSADLREFNIMSNRTDFLRKTMRQDGDYNIIEIEGLFHFTLRSGYLVQDHRLQVNYEQMANEHF